LKIYFNQITKKDWPRRQKAQFWSKIETFRAWISIRNEQALRIGDLDGINSVICRQGYWLSGQPKLSEIQTLSLELLNIWKCVYQRSNNFEAKSEGYHNHW